MLLKWLSEVSWAEGIERTRANALQVTVNPRVHTSFENLREGFCKELENIHRAILAASTERHVTGGYGD